MSVTRLVVAGLCWCALAGVPQELGGWWSRSAQAQAKVVDRTGDKPADRPAGTEVRKPQVRTYSSVTVVDDPKHAPPLPTGRKAVPADAPQPPAAASSAASAPAPADERRVAPELRPDGRDVSPALPERPAKENLQELRRELHDLRQELRDRHGAADGPEPEASPANKKREDSAATKRQERNLRERSRSLRE